MIPITSSPESLSTSSTSASDDTSAAFDLLADHRRRTVLQYLDELDSPVPLDELAEHVTLEEEGHESGPIADWGDALLGTHRRVRISLRHVHVPKLADAGALEFDPEANTVSLRETGAELLAELESTAETDDATTEPRDTPEITTP